MKEARMMKVPPVDKIREAEIAWLSKELSRAIANLGYPVGCGIAPHPEQTEAAAKNLFDRYAQMIEFARAEAPPHNTD